MSEDGMVVDPANVDLDSLLDRYDSQDKSVGRKLLELRASTDYKSFLERTRAVLLQRPPSDSVKFIAGLLEFQDLIQLLLDLYNQSKEHAISFAARLQSCNPRFDTQFLKRYSDRDTFHWSEPELLIALDILDAVSERDRLVLGVSKFLRHANPSIRLRAARFLAKRRPTLGLIADLARESDPIVRLGLIEGLYTRKEEFVAPLFRKHAADPNPDVAAGALLGLYQAGDPESILLIDKMGMDPRPSFRESSAGTMGRTADPRFASNLARLISDPSEDVRRHALRGLAEVKKSLAAVRVQAPLEIVFLRAQAQNGRHCLSFTVTAGQNGPVRGIPGTAFLLKADGSYVRKYQLEEVDSALPVQVGFILCQPPKGEPSVNEEFEDAIERCYTLRRTRDLFLVSKLSHETHMRCSVTDLKMAAAILTKELAGFDLLNPALHLIVVGSTFYTHILDRLIGIGAGSGVAVHVIAVAPQWRTPELMNTVAGSGGTFKLADPHQLPRACFEICSALQHQYRISWEEASGDLELEVRCESGAGSANYGTAA